MPLFFFLLFLVLVVGNSYMITRLLQGFPIIPTWGTILVWGLLFLPIVLFIATFCLNKEVMSYSLMRFGYLIGSSWLFFVLYMVIGLLIIDLFRICFFIPYSSSIIVLCITILLLSWGYKNYTNPKINTVDIRLNKHFEGGRLKVVAISDVHLGYGTTREQLSSYIRKIEEQNPDMIMICGDLIDNSVVPVCQEKMSETLSLLNAPLGIYMVPGNHEYISGIDECQKLLSETNIKLLRDTVIALPNGIQIIGRDDRFNRQRLSLQELMNLSDSNSPVIVMDHQPYEVELFSQLGGDLQFSGHTHNGQIWPISIITDFLFSQSYGYRLWGDTHVYVSSGLSLWGPPFRIGTDSELVVFNIYSEN